jgi:signal transduction histidine kinase
MKSTSIVQLSSQRFLDLPTYMVIGIMYLLGTRNVTDPLVRVIAAILCAAFVLLYAFLLHHENFERYATWYFGAQTVLVGSLLALIPEGSEFFTFLFFMLTIHAAIVFPARTAAAWTVLFYAATSLNILTSPGGDNLVPLLFNVAVFMLCGMFGNNLRQTELARRHNQQLVEELQAAQRQLQELAIAGERNRLAREIHDGLGHYLTATTMQIQGAKALLDNTVAATQAPAALVALGKAETLLQEALADVRRSVAALRATSAVNRPLPAAVAQLVSEHRAGAPSGLGLEVQFELQGEPRPLNSLAELTLYRVAQEGLTNVRKHAQATSVEVTLSYRPDKVRLDIRDNGRGVDQATGGFGLLGLRERVQLQGGVMAIDSRPGQGFRLEVEIPV